MSRNSFITVTITLVAQLFFMGLVEAGSFYRWGASEGPDYAGGVGHMNVDFYWSHSKTDRYTKYRFCWRPIHADGKGKNPCDYNSRDVDKPEIHFDASNQKIHHNKIYRYRIRAKRESNGKWKNLTSTIANPCFRTPIGGHQPLDLSCGPKKLR